LNEAIQFGLDSPGTRESGAWICSSSSHLSPRSMAPTAPPFFFLKP
jgi:hypothetical protein